MTQMPQMNADSFFVWRASLPMALFALIAAGGLSCANPAVCESGASSCVVSTPVVAELGQDFELAPGQIATVKGTITTVTFSRVSADSRCPIGAQCIWEGDAAAQLRVDMSDAQLWSGELHTTLTPKAAAAGSYELALVGVSPVPRTDGSIGAADYRVRLRLTTK